MSTIRPMAPSGHPVGMRKMPQTTQSAPIRFGKSDPKKIQTPGPAKHLAAKILASLGALMGIGTLVAVAQPPAITQAKEVTRVQDAADGERVTDSGALGSTVTGVHIGWTLNSPDGRNKIFVRNGGADADAKAAIEKKLDSLGLEADAKISGERKIQRGYNYLVVTDAKDIEGKPLNMVPRTAKGTLGRLLGGGRANFSIGDSSSGVHFRIEAMGDKRKEVESKLASFNRTDKVVIRGQEKLHNDDTSTGILVVTSPDQISKAEK